MGVMIKRIGLVLLAVLVAAMCVVFLSACAGGTRVSSPPASSQPAPLQQEPAAVPAPQQAPAFVTPVPEQPAPAEQVVPVPQQVAPAPAADVAVYITKTGQKYHLGTCGYLKKSKIPISLSDAKAQGYDACSVCNPPH